MDAPLVSIVTPSFNQGPFLRRTIDSVLEQDYPHLEYLVFDGGSTDDSVAILRSYGPRFSWVSRPDGGQAAAINAGLRQARGQILAYLNSDDVLRPGAVAAVVEAFVARPAVDLVYGEAEWLDEADRPLGPYPTREFDFQRLRRECFLCQPATFWRRHVQDRIGLFNPRLFGAMDYDYWLRLAAAGGQFCRLPQVLAGSRLHAAAKTLASRDRCLSEMIEVCAAHGPVAEDHFHALWEHRATLPNWRGQFLRLHPSLPGRLAYWHSRWRNDFGSRPRDLVAGLLRAASRRLTRARPWPAT